MNGYCIFSDFKKLCRQFIIVSNNFKETKSIPEFVFLGNFKIVNSYRCFLCALIALTMSLHASTCRKTDSLLNHSASIHASSNLEPKIRFTIARTCANISSLSLRIYCRFMFSPEFMSLWDFSCRSRSSDTFAGVFGPQGH